MAEPGGHGADRHGDVGGDPGAVVRGGVRRSDAVRNRAKILEAAGTLTHGGRHGEIDVSVEAVARRAGVAVGTVYRHWPSKRDLLQSVLLSRLEVVAAAAEAAGSLGQFLDEVTEHCVRDLTLLALLDDAGSDGPFDESEPPSESDGQAKSSIDPERAALRRRFDTALNALISGAAAGGHLRNPLRPGDVRVYLIGLRAALRSGDADAWRRYRDIYVAGLLGSDDARG